MVTYIAFLRAINLGATRKFPQASIVAAVEAAGGTDVETYINTGNVRLTSRLRSRARVEQVLEEAFLADRGFAVPTIVLTRAELVAVAACAEGYGHDGKHYVSLLKDEPTAEGVAAMEAAGSADEVARVGGRAVHLMLAKGLAYDRFTNVQVERHLGVATNRNLTVIRALAEKWG